MFDFIELSHYAKLAELAYTDDAPSAANAFGVFGYSVLGQYKDDDHLAYVLMHKGAFPLDFVLAISGTRFGRSVGDVVDDARIAPVTIGVHGECVAAGPWDGMRELWAWALNITGDLAKWTVCGHSLGGERAMLSLMMPHAGDIDRVFAYEAPKCANDAAWAAFNGQLSKITTVVNGNDLWAGWPMVSEYRHPPISHIWLDGDSAHAYTREQLPLAWNPKDHDISDVVAKLDGLAASAKP